MLIVCRTKAPRRELTVIGSQYHRVRRVEMPVKMGCSRRSASPWLVLPGMRSAVETESAVRKCSLAVIGEVSALASRNQVIVLALFFLISVQQDPKPYRHFQSQSMGRSMG